MAPRRDWERRWHEVKREVGAILAAHTEPIGGATFQTAHLRLQQFYIQAYHFKDALAGDTRIAGVSRRAVENAITADENLALLADLANLEKHHRLNNAPRSGYVPVITKVGGDSVDGGWRLKVVIRHNGRALDGLFVARAAVDAWQSKLTDWGLV